MDVILTCKNLETDTAYDSKFVIKDFQFNQRFDKFLNKNLRCLDYNHIDCFINGANYKEVIESQKFDSLLYSNFLFQYALNSFLVGNIKYSFGPEWYDVFSDLKKNVCVQNEIIVSFPFFDGFDFVTAKLDLSCSNGNYYSIGEGDMVFVPSQKNGYNGNTHLIEGFLLSDLEKIQNKECDCFYVDDKLCKVLENGGFSDFDIEPFDIKSYIKPLSHLEPKFNNKHSEKQTNKQNNKHFKKI